MSVEDIEIAIIGAGLSGLAAGLQLQKAGRAIKILEARQRTGGRIHSARQPETGAIVGDLGPTWVWPPYQPVVRKWLERLNLSLFDQFEDGQAIVDAGPGQPLQLGFAPGQQGIARVRGYSQALILALEAGLPDDAITIDSPVTAVETTGSSLILEIGGAQPRQIRADKVICALPPRLAVSQITWRPGLPPALTQAMQSTPTWMASHAKAVAIFDRAHWRDKGMSGRIVGRTGPLAEAHDHSGPDGVPAGIFGFIGWPHQMRAEHAARLSELISTQLERCFGALPTTIWIEDWACDPFTATPDDLRGPMEHPTVGPSVLRAPLFDGRLVFAGAETASQSPGLIEGALVSADHAAAVILADAS
ncbi:MAG: NAD(P)/FAD-dependent oxidoreductase [Pseudomonadota bacterium]